MIEVEQVSEGYILRAGPTQTRVSAVDASIIRVVHTDRQRTFGASSLMIVEGLVPRGNVLRESASEPNALALQTDRLTLRIDRQTGQFSWLDANHQPLFRESPPSSAQPATGGRSLEPINVERRIFDESIRIEAEHTTDGIKARVANAKVIVDRVAYSTQLSLQLAEGEMIFGLGQHEEGILNYRGHTQYLYQQNMKVAMPVIVSSRGYAILFDTAALGVFRDGPAGASFWSEVGDALDFYVIYGPEFDQIVASLRKLTGRPTMFPRWAYGYIQSRERYRTQQELIDVAAEFRRRGIPLDCIVQDWCTWTGREWGNKTPDAERFPDPSQLARQLHAMNCRLMVSIWPIMRGECRDQVEMRQAGFLLGNDATYDAFNPAARALYWEQAHRGWFRHGIDAWWCDCTEPFEADWKGPFKPGPQERVKINTGESKTFLDPQFINAYSMLHSRGIYEHQRAATEQKRVVNLTRSGFPGQQRYGAITWSGDISAKWSTLRKQIADGLNFCVTGNPKWTLDIGAFFVKRDENFWFRDGDFEGCDDPGYRELYARWFQFGAFLPMFRSHGTDCPREPWRFGEPGEPAFDALLDALHLRYRLLPYIYSIAAWETFFDYTMYRMLAFDFRHDPAACGVADQFMFGPAFLVCPVTAPGATARPVYLPAHAEWIDFWTGQMHTGGKTIHADAPLRRIPLFVRAGSIVPMGPIVQHAAEALNAPIELRVYPGGDGRFMLYEDEYDNYNYERGQYAMTPIAWDDRGGILTVGPRAGTFRGMVENRDYRIVRVQHGRGVGIAPTETRDHVITGGGEARWAS